MHRFVKSFCALVICLLVLQACGQTGALYMPPTDKPGSSKASLPHSP